MCWFVCVIFCAVYEQNKFLVINMLYYLYKRYRKEVNVVRNWMIALLVKYGMWGAGMPSIHGSYEAPVHKALQKTAEK